MACRQPRDGFTHLQYEKFLERNQRRSVNLYINDLRNLAHIYENFEYTTTNDELDSHYNDPHQKKILRVQFYNDAIDDGSVGLENFTRRRKVNIKFKTNEIGKPGKVGRCIGDLGVAMSMVGFRSTNFLKEACESLPLQFDNGTAQFCKSPGHEELTNVFSNLIDPPKSFYLAYFSDDACLSYRHKNKIIKLNIDISSCDASHRSIFDVLLAITPPSLMPSMNQLMKQLEYPVTFYSEDKKTRVEGYFSGRTLFSGSTVTTMLNNCVYILFAHHFSAKLHESDDVNIPNLFEDLGYIVTYEECETYHTLQFLKHSPVYDVDGHLQPLLNPGVMIRASGVCNGDLPGRGDLRERASSFQHSLLNGMYPRVDFTLIRNMKRKAVKYFEVNTDEYTKTKTQVTGYFQVSDVEVYKRYDLEPYEVEELNEIYGNSGYGDYTVLTGLEKILDKDYGLKLNWFAPVLDVENQNNQMGLNDRSL
jgi:hypothetical protein